MDPAPGPVSRRRFMRTAGILGAGLVAGCTDSPTTYDAPVRLARSGGGKPTTRNPLRIPTVQAPTGTLTAAPATVELGGGRSAGVWAYNGQFPGPTLQLSTGGTNTIHLVNGLAEPTITHWHGMLVNEANDGHPKFAIAPDGTYDYSYNVSQRATLNWYHPHPHMLTGEQVAMGLAGAFIIRDSVEAGLGLPAGLPYEVPLIVRDATFDRAGNMLYKPRSGGFDGDTPLVNGTLDPTFAADAAVYRFRILNGSNARIYRFVLSSGDPFILIGNDGGLLSAASSLTEIKLAPAERLDVLVDLRTRGGSTLMLRDLNTGWDLLEIVVGSRVVSNLTIPTSLSTITPLGIATVTRDFSFDGMSKINGKLYDVNRIDFEVTKGVTELWRFTTRGNAPHPVHVHGAYYQIQSRAGGRAQVFPWEAGWKDTVLLEDGETVEVLIRFDHTAVSGTYLIHCHKLEHEDMGMMSNFDVS